MPEVNNSFKLADYSVTGSIAAQIAVFGSKLAQQHRDAQKLGWDTTVKYAELEHANMLKQADEMRSAAGARLAGAITQGVLGVAGGAVQVGASAKAMGYARRAGELEREQQAAAARQASSPSADPLQAASAPSAARRAQADANNSEPAPAPRDPGNNEPAPQRADGGHAAEYNSINTQQSNSNKREFAVNHRPSNQTNEQQSKPNRSSTRLQPRRRPALSQSPSEHLLHD